MTACPPEEVPKRFTRRRGRRGVAALRIAAGVLAALLLPGCVPTVEKDTAAGRIYATFTTVTAVDRGTGIVGLRLIEGSKVREGTVFRIYRGQKYIGQAEVTMVARDAYGARIVEARKPIEVGDRAHMSRTGEEDVRFWGRHFRGAGD